MESLTKFDQLCVEGNASIRKALEILNKSQVGIILITNKSNKLLGTLTDGDIRRGLLSGKVLETKILEVMNKKFFHVSNSDDYSNYKKIFLRKGLRHIPVLDEEGKLIKLLINNDFLKHKSLPNPVVIMPGGIGSRLRPQTNNCPKPMLKINGKPILEIVIEKCIDDGFHDFFISVNYLKEIISDYFGDGSKWDINIQYLEEKEPLGTAGSLELLPRNINYPFLVLNGDVLTKFNPHRLLEFHNNHEAYATLSVREYIVDVPFGVIETEGVEVQEIIEKPSYKKHVNAGVYALDPSILDFIKSKEKIDMPELFSRLKNHNKKIVACPIPEYWIDIGRPESLKEAYLTWDNDDL